MDFTLLKQGDFILFHTKGFSLVSMAIRSLTESYWNHVGCYVEEDGKGYVIEALFRGVAKTSIEKYIGSKAYEFKAVRLKEESFKDIEEYINGIKILTVKLYSHIGNKYDFMAIAWLSVRYLFKGIFKKIPYNPLQHRSKFFCSELVCKASVEISSLMQYLFMGKTKSNCSTTTPKDVSKSANCQYVSGLEIN